MSANSKIEWTDHTWNPIRAIRRNAAEDRAGWHCEHVSEGCRYCYAEAMNRRLGTGLDFKPGRRGNIEMFLDEKMLAVPMRWKKARRIFVCSMTDLFADFVKDEWIDRMFAVMALCPQHNFQILTKRPERMKAYLAAPDRDRAIDAQIRTIVGDDRAWKESPFGGCKPALPLPNVWLGTSCEDQGTADERIPHLLATPAAVRFLSCEPLLGPLDIRRYLAPAYSSCQQTNSPAIAAIARKIGKQLGGRYVDWTIVGGESGPEARPMHPDWARWLRDQCAAAGVPFFFNQWGSWAHGALNRNWMLVSKEGYPEIPDDRAPMDDIGEVAMTPMRKRDAGRLLDGIEHNGYPE